MTAQKISPLSTDAFDPNIVPAETKARKEREGDNYKQTPDNAPDPDSIHTADGYTVDTEGLINNYAVEPPMYIEQPGDMAQTTLPVVEKFTVVDVFPTQAEAETAAVEIHKAGISRSKISILGKDYQDNTDRAHGELNWQDIQADGGLAIVIGKNDEALKTQEIFLNSGHRVSDRQG
jgi:hypothetical protein